MMLFVTMKKRNPSNYKGKGNHGIFKCLIFNDIHPKKRKRIQKKRQNGTMNGTCQRCSNPNDIQI